MPRSVAITPELCVAGRSLGEPRLSRDGAVVAFTSTWGPRSAICVVPVDGGLERAVTTLPEPKPGRGGGSFVWTADGAALIYAAVDGNLWRQPVPGGAPDRLTDLGPATPAQSPAASPDGRRVAFVVDLAELRVVEFGENVSRRVGGTGDFVVDPTWAPDGRLAWSEWSVPNMAWDESRIVVLGDLSGRAGVARVVLGSEGHQAQQPRFSGDGALWHLRDDTGWLNVWRDDRPAVAEPFEHGGPTWGVGQRSFAVAPDGSQVAFSRNEGGFGRLCIGQVSDSDPVVRQLGRGVHTQLSWSGGRVAAVRSGARTPPEIVTYDVSAGERTIVARSAPLGWDHADLREPEAVRWSADDRATIPGRLYQPVGGGDGRLICWIHGGPTDQWTVSFMARLAFWLDRGWSILVPDFRGTTGHGREHQQQMRHRWGELDVTDTLAGLRHAHRSGWGTPDRTVVFGGSSGGFTALHLAARAPELFRAASVSFPVSDLIALDATTHRFEAHYNASLVGDRPRHDERYRDRSPLTFAARVGVPLLVLHGDADPVVALDQSRALVERIGAAGGTAELHVYAGEGHGFRDPDNQLDEYRRVAEFVGRYVT